MTQTHRAVLIGLIAGMVALPLAAQTTRQLHVTVTDPLNRFVTGLDRDHFEVVVGGVRSQITAFSDTDSPIAIAVVGDAPMQAIASLNGPNDLLIQTKSLAEALSQLAASTNPRKGVVITTATDNAAIPGGIQVMRVDASNLKRAVVELRNQYLLQVQSEGPASGMEVLVKQPRGFPQLRAQLSPIASK